VDYDVAIIGGGPAGATTGTLLKKYRPDFRVGIFEREVFPRDHVGESQLPGISSVLDEMGCWDKVEAADFPIKIGGTYRWGKKAELWDIQFFPTEKFQDQPRPAKFEGQRKSTAFQVDRAIYDKILLDHTRECGCDVFEDTRVLEVGRDGDRVTHLTLESGEQVHARYFIDASGHSGLLRRSLGVEVDYPTSLQNIAIWDYWQNATWAVEIGVGGTFIQVLSLGYGWIWFIPLGPTRTSIGLVVPASYYKESGLKPGELYDQAWRSDPRLVELMRTATSEGKLQTTKDWSFVAQRQAGENWFLVGECAGFADPILSAGLTMAHIGARELVYTILELERGELDAAWLKEQFELRQSLRVRNHIRFADYWYTANGQFSDLKDFTAQIARDADLELTPEGAWSWLAQGGFINEDMTIGAGGYSLNAVKALGEFLTDVSAESPWLKYNVLKLNLDGAELKDRARYEEGGVQRCRAYKRGDRILPEEGIFLFLLNILRLESDLPLVVERLRAALEPFRVDPVKRNELALNATQGLEAMINDGWIDASYDPSMPLTDLRSTYNAMRWTPSA